MKLSNKVLIISLLFILTLTTTVAYGQERAIRGIWVTDVNIPDTVHAGEEVPVEFTYDYAFSYTYDDVWDIEYLSDVPVNIWIGNTEIGYPFDEYFNLTGDGTDTYTGSFIAPEQGTYELVARADFLDEVYGSDGWEYMFVTSQPLTNITITLTVLPAESTGTTDTGSSTTDDTPDGGGIPGFPLITVIIAVPFAVAKRKNSSA
jgi:hypothetical protein